MAANRRGAQSRNEKDRVTLPTGQAEEEEEEAEEEVEEERCLRRHGPWERSHGLSVRADFPLRHGVMDKHTD
ncbi:hypothetical protein EYF80_012156 [Liparis tanakae]|uniref:Uncharacterized protein n=1 Tax=Liparis tanakae TaxID=230148 RepID=A0A4Z2II07_9TELE|nr:hypothetical protein EYF80_012156 [Liparis tanakae]